MPHSGFFCFLKMSDMMRFPVLAVFSGIWVKPKVGLSQMGEDSGGCCGGAGAAVAMGTGAPRRVLGGGKQVTHLIRKAD